LRLHLVDGTYELFRAYFGAPPARAPGGREVGATRGLMRSMLSLLAEPGVTHVACAFDHVIESFRNDLYPGYKTGEGIAPDLLDQFELVERATRALGIVVWSMVEFEADDALAAGAARWADGEGVEQVVICTPDKDLRQCVRGTKVVCLDRRQRAIADEAAVRARYGIGPESIPDWLALVGDTSDGYPGLPRWGEKSASAVLGRYAHLEDIPDDHRQWQVDVRGALALADSIRTHRDEAMLFRRLATLRTDVPLPETLDDLRWRGGRRAELEALCAEIGEEEIAKRMPLWREGS
jgi:5'-3' exonuclease